MKLVHLVGLGIEPSSGTPVVVLREDDEPHRLLPILVGETEAASIALAASGETADRPLTHDLMAALVQSLDAEIDAAEVTELRDGSFLARLALHGPTGEQVLDTRPSDAIALAVRMGTPLFVTEAVLEEAGSLPEPVIDDDAIDEAVDEFRTFLDDLDPSEFRVDDQDG